MWRDKQTMVSTSWKMVHQRHWHRPMLFPPNTFGVSAHAFGTSFCTGPHPSES
jgi:hypothetical protein